MNFNNLRVVLTGTAPGQKSRKQIESFLRGQGALIENRISMGTDLLIYGRSNTVKYKQAQEKGVRTVTYDEYFDLVASGNSLDRVKMESAKNRATTTRAMTKGAKKLKSLRKELSSVQTSAAEW